MSGDQLSWRPVTYIPSATLSPALIDKLRGFLLELGKGFSFVARQKRVSSDAKHYFIDPCVRS
jgi:predicted nuclease of restriction endonuclease-like (RecB) superfamily